MVICVRGAQFHEANTICACFFEQVSAVCAMCDFPYMWSKANIMAGLQLGERLASIVLPLQEASREGGVEKLVSKVFCR